jgi:acyl-CoA thioesterase
VAYFQRTGPHTFRATDHVGGAWHEGTQHIAPALGLLVHAVQSDLRVRRTDDLVVCRLSYDILGTVPVTEVETRVEVVRAGRTIELVEAELRHADRSVVRLRAWLLARHDTAEQSGTGLRPIPPPESMAPWDPTTVWSGGFIASAEVRRQQAEPGRAAYWVRTSVPLLEDEEVSRVATVAGLLDIANGMTVRLDPHTVAYPNVDLTAHLFAEPHGEWVGFDTAVSVGPSGLGLTSSVIHDVDGPVGTVAQMLTVRPH